MGPAMVPPREPVLGVDPAHPGRALVDLAKTIGVQAADREACLQAITETAAALLRVDRASIWFYDGPRTSIECEDLFERNERRHSQGLRLEASRFPAYFESLEEARIIAAHDAESDARTAEFTESYLRPLGIGAMLDAPIRVAGSMVGVLCHEALGPAREWTPAEQALAASLGDFVALTIETSERARAEAERHEMSERLARARKMEALGRLAGSIAHDFNNLLTAIHGSVELVRHARKRDSLSDQFLHDELGQIEHAADRAGRLVRQLLSFSRNEVVETQVMNTAAALEATRSLLVRVLGDTIRLELEIDPDTPYVEFDPSQFDNLVLNLASNARDAMPHGGVLTIRSHALERHGACWMELQVQDSGAGIPPEVLPLIFEPFYSTKSMGTGWGLGLATVQRLIESAGGHIFVRSQPEQGTVFRIHLPAVDPPAEVIGEQTGSVLICEDESKVRAALEATLADAGYDVETARDAAQARKRMKDRTEPLDLLLTDVILPGANGPMLAEEFTRDHPEMRVLFVSGYTADELLRNGVAADGDRLITKPCKPREVLRRVREALSAARS